MNSLPFIIKKGRRTNASILYEMPSQKGNEGCQGNNYEEWQTGDPGCMPCMRYQDVQDREGITLIQYRDQIWAGYFNERNTQPFSVSQFIFLLDEGYLYQPSGHISIVRFLE